MDLFHPGTPSPPSLEARVRVIADIAGALIQIHDNSGLPRLHRRHGRLTPRHLLIGVDGSASLFNAREPFSKLLPPQPDLGYLAPELLTQSGPATQQSDVFSLGVLLWEALDNGRLFPHRRAAAISRLIARRSLPGPRIEEEWALPLADVAMKALAQNPEDRFLDGTAFWLALREHLPAPDAARLQLSRLAQRALKLELTTDIRDEPPYLAPRLIGVGASLPPSRSSFAVEPETEAPARYSLHPERSSRHAGASPSHAAEEAWVMSDAPPAASQSGGDSSALALAAQQSRSRRPSAKPLASEPASAARSSPSPPSPRPPLSQPPARHQDGSPISTLHVNLPRELVDASLPFYVSGPPAPRPFPWGALIFAALVFFGVGAAVAFGAVTALRTLPSATQEDPREANPSADVPIAAPAGPTGPASPADLPEPPAPVLLPVLAEGVTSPAASPSVSASPAPSAATENAGAEPPTGSAMAAPAAERTLEPVTKIPDPGHKQVRRAKPARPKRPKPVPPPVLQGSATAAEAPAAPEPSLEIIREVPEEAPPPSPPPSPPSGDTEIPPAEPPADLPFVDQPY